MPKGEGQIWNQQAGGERLQEHKGLLLNFVLAVKPQIAVNRQNVSYPLFPPLPSHPSSHCTPPPLISPPPHLRHASCPPTFHFTCSYPFCFSEFGAAGSLVGG